MPPKNIKKKHSKIISKLKLCLGIVVLLCISACALTPKVQSTIAVFHKLPEEPASTKYAFFPLPNQKNDLEYQTYQNLIKKELEPYQFQEVPMKKADVVISFTYMVGEGTVKTGSLPIFGQTGISSSSTSGSINTYGNYGTYSGTTTYTPTYGVTGAIPYSFTTYGRGLWLCIADKSTVGKKKDLNILYQASVVSEGTSNQLPEVLPAMISALFKKFPGKSGVTRREAVPMNTNNKKLITGKRKRRG